MRYFISVKYDGTAFRGSQIQGDTPTVQNEINKAISTLLRFPVLTYGASRTDADVHALDSYFHFDYTDEIDDNFVYRLNAILPREISVNQILIPKNQEEANARFDALSRQYRYYIYNKKDPFLQNRAYFYPYKIEEELLHQTAAIILQKTDFDTFSKRNTQNKTTICKIEKAIWTFEKDQPVFMVRANRFLRGMVRGLTGTQLLVARGKMSIDEFEGIFEKKNCRLADFSVPGYGLYLEKIFYPEGYFMTQ